MSIEINEIPTKASLEIVYADESNYTVSGLSPSASADALALLAEGVSALQSRTPIDLISIVQYELVGEEIED
ncbi:MAG: hypothetical protein LBQ68_02890 [Clostridiales bacterium]|jgi:hypothetical protein|nr:hypothetical protein [Clostridiales bacterium]